MSSMPSCSHPHGPPNPLKNGGITLADLRRQFGKKTLLTPEDLADVIAQSPGAQAVARHRGRFDIPLTKRGRKIYVSIYDLADWLASGGTPATQGPYNNAANPTKATSAVSKPPRRQSLASILVLARQALDFDAEVFAALEAISLATATKKPD